jgi:probable F420-dependent oxidoreductase
MPNVLVSTGFVDEREVMELAPVIERLGFDGITVPDHLFHPHHEEGHYPYSKDGKPPFRLDTPWPDGLTLLAAVGSVTERLRLITSVLILPLRHPVTLAKAAATTARLSGGRLTIGMGVGWMREEFEALGVDFTTRGRRANEMIPALRALWRKGPTEHHGEFFSFGPLFMEPVPPPIPIVVGGASDAAFQRAARLGDGYLMPRHQLDEVPGLLRRLRAALADAGRDERDFEIIVPCVDGTPTAIESLVEHGVDTIVVVPWPFGGRQTTSLQDKIAHLERYAETVLERVRGLSPAG